MKEPQAQGEATSPKEEVLKALQRRVAEYSHQWEGMKATLHESQKRSQALEEELEKAKKAFALRLEENKNAQQRALRLQQLEQVADRIIDSSRAADPAAIKALLKLEQLPEEGSPEEAILKALKRIEEHSPQLFKPSPSPRYAAATGCAPLWAAGGEQASYREMLQLKRENPTLYLRMKG